MDNIILLWIIWHFISWEISWAGQMVSFAKFGLKFVVNVFRNVLSTVFILHHFISTTETPTINTVKDDCHLPGKAAVQLCVIGNGGNKNPIDQSYLQ